MFHTKHYFWALFLFPLISTAQKRILFDTIQKDYKTEINNLYTQRVILQKQQFSQQIQDKKTRNEVEKSYTEVSNDFKENIDKGIFVDNKMFRSTINSLVEKIQNNNSSYKQLKDSKILLSFGSSPNAYAIGNDFVVLYIPLLHKLENEMQMAFIICHEIAHNLLKHSYKSIVDYATLKHSEDIKKQTREIEKKKYNKGQIASGLYKDIVYGKRKNNRLYEHQADSLGFILFQNAFPQYTHESIKTLKLLEHIDKETDSLSPDDYFKLFNTEKSPFKESWISSNELSEYNYEKNSKFWAVDSLKTHPDCEVRIEYLNKHFKIAEKKEITASDEFILLKTSSLYNHILGLYFTEDYGKSLYESLKLYKNNTEDEFLKHMIKSNLIQLQQAQNNYTLNKYLETNNPKFSDSYNTFLYFLRQLRKSQMNAIINKYES